MPERSSPGIEYTALDTIRTHLFNEGWRTLHASKPVDGFKIAIYGKNGRVLMLQETSHSGCEVWYPTAHMKTLDILAEIDAYAARKG